MQFRVLGRIEVRRDEQPVAVGGPKVRALLAILLLHSNQVVSRDRLLEGLWGEAPPPAASHTLDDYVSRLRKVVGVDRVVTSAPGYLLVVEEDELDLAEFERLVVQGRHELVRPDPAAAARTLERALALWSGPALADVLAEPFAAAEARLLEERRLGALELRFDAELAAGAAPELVPDLEALVREHPYRERLLGQLMLALYRSGRTADALAAMRAGAQRLTSDLGLAPGPDLLALERAILNHDPTLRLPARRYRPRPRDRLVAAGALVAAATAVSAIALLRTVHDAPAGEPRFVAGYVADTSGFGDRFWNEEAAAALRRLHLEQRIPIRLLRSRTDADYLPNLAALARACSFVFVPGDLIDPLGRVAPQFPRTTFVLLDRSRRDVPGRPPNVVGVTFREEQGSYAAGYLAVAFLRHLHVRHPILGSVGGVRIPPVERFIAGFEAGARAAAPDVTLLREYTGSFVHRPLCRAAARREIESGAQVVFAVAGGCGDGVFQAASSARVWAVGVDSIRTAARAYTIATVLKRYDVAVAWAVRAALNGDLRPRSDLALGIGTGAIGIGGVNRAVPRTLVATTRSLANAIAYGSSR